MRRAVPLLTLVLLLLCSVARADPLASLLDRRAAVPGFGNIAYRAPLVGARGPVLVLFHGVFGGASHRSFREVLPLLDGAGARVYLMDLPGVGQSDSPRRVYTIETLDQFVEAFLVNIVREPATLVMESVLGTSGLTVSQWRPDLVNRVVLLSPTGVSNLEGPPTASQTNLFDAVYGNDGLGLLFYGALLSDPSVRFFLKRAYYDDRLVTDTLVRESQLALLRPGQRWISFAFVGGKIYRRFADVAPAVTAPVLAVFGANAESPASGAPAETPAGFRAIRPDFEYLVVPRCGLSVQREQPAAVAAAITRFAR